jgi:hypothetical protein
MSEVIYSTKVYVKGPWLIDADALIQLDEILNDEWIRLQHRKEELLDGEAESQIRAWRELGIYEELSEEELRQKKEKLKEEKAIVSLHKDKKEIRIYLPKSRSVVTNSFQAAFREQAIVEEMPIGFRVELQCGEVRCEMSLKREYNELSINVTPEKSREAWELFIALRQWVVKNRAPTWQRVWSGWAGFQWIIWVALIFLSATIISESLDYATPEAKSRAQKLLDSGISEAEIPEAVELLLILQTKYNPGQPKPQLPSWFKVVLVGGLIACVILSIRPKVVLGIGRGMERIIWWRRWLRFVGITLPTLIFGSFVWPYIEQTVQKFLP